jgi:FkbM family methyltransferase
MSSPSTQPVLNADDAPYRHFTLKHRTIAWISNRFFDDLTYTVRRGLLRGMKRKGGLGWLPVFLSGAETPEHLFWSSLDLTGAVVYDVGAFHGLLTLLFASQARQVVSYEPNHHNRQRLEENLALNHLTNVTIRPVGLGSSRETLSMAFHPLTPGGASLMQGTAEPAIRPSGVSVEKVSITTLDLDIEEGGLPIPDFIKIDTEGWELEAIRGADRTLSRHHPSLFLEMHGETMNEKRRKVAQIVDHLGSIGYRSIRHIETSTEITTGNSAVAAQGHLWCRVSDTQPVTTREPKRS